MILRGAGLLKENLPLRTLFLFLIIEVPKTTYVSLRLNAFYQIVGSL